MENWTSSHVYFRPHQTFCTKKTTSRYSLSLILKWAFSLKKTMNHYHALLTLNLNTLAFNLCSNPLTSTIERYQLWSQMKKNWTRKINTKNQEAPKKLNLFNKKIKNPKSAGQVGQVFRVLVLLISSHKNVSNLSRVAGTSAGGNRPPARVSIIRSNSAR